MTLYVVSDGHFRIQSLFPDEENRGPFDLVISNVRADVAKNLIEVESRRNKDDVIFYLPGDWPLLFSKFLDAHIGLGVSGSPQLSNEHVFIVVRPRLQTKDPRGDEFDWLWYTITCF